MDFQITGQTRFGGLLGSPVRHSISPMMHNLSFRLLGLDCVYLCFEVTPQKLGQTVSVFRDLGCYGFNLTMPDKKAVMPYLDAISQEAELIGAVNTVVCRDGRLTGYNTDGYGFWESARQEGFQPEGRGMTLLGAGGAAGAIAVQGALDGLSQIHILNRHTRSWEAAERLVSLISRETSCRADLSDLADEGMLAEKIAGSDILVNATPVGMAGRGDDGKPEISGEMPVPADMAFSPDMWVGDVIYHPRRTALLQKAEQEGCRTFNGMKMLLYQGAKAFELWTGQRMPVEEVQKAFFS